MSSALFCFIDCCLYSIIEYTDDDDQDIRTDWNRKRSIFHFSFGPGQAPVGVCCADIYTSVVHGSQPGPSVITPLWFMCGNYSQTSDSIHIGLTVWSYIVQVSHSLGLTFAFDMLLPGTISSIRGGRVVRHGPPWCGSIKWIHSLIH